MKSFRVLKCRSKYDISDERQLPGGSELQMVNDKKNPRGGEAENSGPI